MNKEKALELAEKLLELASHERTGNAEAQAAIAGLKRILSSHDLSLFDVKERKQKEEIIEEEVKTDMWRVHQWVKVLATNMALALNCRVVFSRYTNPDALKEPTKPYCRKYVFIGAKTDADIASFFFDVFLMKLPELAVQEGRASSLEGKELLAYINSYIIAAARVLRVRIQEYFEEQEMVRLGKKHPKIVQEAFEYMEMNVEGEAENVDIKEEYAMVLKSKQDALDKYMEKYFGLGSGQLKESEKAKRERDQRLSEQAAAQAGFQEGSEGGQKMGIHQGLHDQGTGVVLQLEHKTR